MKVVLLTVVLVGTCAYAQDPGTAAMQLGAQQAQQQMQQDMMNAATQANQQSIQQLNQMAQQNQLNQINPVNSHQCYSFLQTGKSTSASLPWNSWRVIETGDIGFSAKPGQIKPGAKVRIKWHGSDYAAIYYTTDGSAPTPSSKRYTRPIIINVPTHVQAVGVGWNCTRSKIIDAHYDVPSGTASVREP